MATLLSVVAFYLRDIASAASPGRYF